MTSYSLGDKSVIALTLTASPFNWEMGVLFSEGILDGVSFMETMEVVANPFATTPLVP
jgi:hypothetical protein